MLREKLPRFSMASRTYYAVQGQGVHQQSRSATFGCHLWSKCLLRGRTVSVRQTVLLESASCRRKPPLADECLARAGGLALPPGTLSGSTCVPTNYEAVLMPGHLIDGLIRKCVAAIALIGGAAVFCM